MGIVPRIRRDELSTALLRLSSVIATKYFRADAGAIAVGLYWAPPPECE